MSNHTRRPRPLPLSLLTILSLAAAAALGAPGVGGCAKAKPAGTTPLVAGGGGAGGDGSGPAPGGERRWVYSAEVMNGEDGEPMPHEVALVESARRDVDGVRVIELDVWLDNARLDDEGLAQLSGAPFTTFGTKLVLLVATQAGHKAVWLVFTGNEPLDAAAVKEAMSELPTWTLSDAARGPRPKLGNEPEDQVFQFGAKAGASNWESYCVGYVHPSPESGDYFVSERCLAPDLGMTKLDFESVWGGYELELKQGPAGWGL